MTRREPVSKYEHVPLASCLLYGISGIPISMVGTCLSLYMLFYYTKTLGLDPRYVGIVAFTGSIWDAFSDQLMGQISDRTPWKWGRRRPYFLIGAIPFGLSFYLIMAPPEHLTEFALFVHLFIWRIMLYTGSTIIHVPLYALAPEMAQTYHDRTRLTAWREGFGNFGDLLGMLAVPLLGLLFFRYADPRVSHTQAGVVGLALTGICMMLAYLGSYEDPRFTADQPTDWKAAWKDGFVALRENRPFRLLIFATAFPGMAIQIIASLFLFIITDVLAITDEMFQMKAFLFYACSAMGSYPIWTFIARRVSKAAVFRSAMALMAFAYMSVYVLGEGTLLRLYPIMACAGAGAAGFWMAMFSQLADITDFDELQFGARRENLFAGFASLMRKIGYAFGNGTAAIGLWLVGFDGDAAVQSASVILGLKMVFSIPTTCFALLGIYIFWRYPITEVSHAEVRRQLDARRAQLDR